MQASPWIVSRGGAVSARCSCRQPAAVLGSLRGLPSPSWPRSLLRLQTSARAFGGDLPLQFPTCAASNKPASTSSSPRGTDADRTAKPSNARPNCGQETPARLTRTPRTNIHPNRSLSHAHAGSPRASFRNRTRTSASSLPTLREPSSIMDIRRLLHNPDDGGWYIIGETKSETEMNDFRRSLKRNAIINTHLVNCTMNHESLGVDVVNTEHKMKVQWTKCTSALCHPKGDNQPDAFLDEQGKPRACPVQVRMSTCQLTFAGIVCQAYQHLSEEHDSAEPLQTSVTEDMKTHIVRMLQENPEVKPMAIYKELSGLHEQGVFGSDLMPTKIQLRNALTYLRSRKLKQSSGSGGSLEGTPRKRRYDSFSDGSESPPLEEHRQPEY